MKSILLRLFLIYSAICIIPHVSGQINIRGLDTIPVIKPKRNKFTYKYDYNGPRELSFVNSNPVIIQRDKKRPLLRDFGNDVLTMVTGIGWVSSANVLWEFGSLIKCNDALPDWSIDLFCEGKQETERSRVRDSDGSSVESETTNIYLWDKNATGIIIEGADTIGSFLIIMNPREDSLLRPLSDFVFQQRQIEINTVLNNKWYMQRLFMTNTDYGIVGTFRNKKFSVISNSSARKTWFFSDNKLWFVFQPDLDNIGMKKKDRIMPYLLINTKKPDSEKPDFFRLAIMSRYLSTVLK